MEEVFCDRYKAQRNPVEWEGKPEDLNDDAVIDLCDEILTTFMIEYETAKNHSIDHVYYRERYVCTVETCRYSLTTPFFEAMLNYAGITPEDVVQRIEGEAAVEEFKKMKKLRKHFK